MDVVVTGNQISTASSTTLRRIQFLVSRGQNAGSGVLREAVTVDSVELASCLLDSEAEVDNVVDPEKTSPLMVAAGQGYQELVKLLLSRGGSTQLVDREGRDAMAIANGSGHESIGKFLQAHE